MNINKSNYESWFLDYYEGTLAAEKVAELFLFLEQYPEFKNEFESFAQIKLPKTEEVFSFKDSLKKNTITATNYNDYLIADLEGDLNLQERVALKSFMASHPELEKEKLLFSKTILQKEGVNYPAKDELKKPVIVTHKKNTSILWVAAAAMILLLIGVYFIQRPEKAQVAEKENNSLQESVGEKEKSLQSTNDKQLSLENIAPKIENALNKSLETASLSHSGENRSEVNKRASNHHKKIKHEIVPEISSRENNSELAMIRAEKIEPQLVLNVSEEMPAKTSIQKTSDPIIPAKRSLNPLQLLDNAKTVAANKINSATDEEIFYPVSKSSPVAEQRLPLKSRMLKLFAWTVNKVTDDRVILNTDFYVDGNLAAYQLTAGKLKIEKDF